MTIEAHQVKNKQSCFWLAEAVLHSYSILFFTQKLWVGACLLLATFLAPKFALFGLSSLVVALGFGILLGFDKLALRDGRLLFNSLLVGMTVAYLQGYQEIAPLNLAVLLITASVLALFVSTMLNTLVYNLTGLPAMSLPFVIVSLLFFFLFFSLNYTPVVATGPKYLLNEPAFLPEILRAFLQSFGSLLFLPHSIIGGIVFVSLLLHSRLSVIYSLVGFISGTWFIKLFGYDPTPEMLAWVSFNFVLTGIALGGGFFVPSRSSLVLVILGGFFCSTIAVAVQVFLGNFNIPPLALPFNLVVLMMVYALRLRVEAKSLFPAPIPGASPEQNFRKFVTNKLQFQDSELPAFWCPFAGNRTITQGFHGGITHRDEWSHALDFEILGAHSERSEPANSANLKDYFTYNSPVLAPVNGQVVRAVNYIEDNAAGENNLSQNWGNLVIIRVSEAVYVKLCHFKFGSIIVQEGEHVIAGALLGYCGNSGRSPFPHLHMQVQPTADVGASTIPFRLLNYKNGKHQFQSRSIPKENETIQSIGPSRNLSSCFELIQQSYSYQVETNNGVHNEEIICSLDSYGNFNFQSKQFGTKITAKIIDYVFTVIDQKGSPNSILLMALPSLQRVPLMLGKQLKWSELQDLTIMETPWTIALRNLTDPFIGSRQYRVRSTMDYEVTADSSETWTVSSDIEKMSKSKIVLSTNHWMQSGMYSHGSKITTWKINHNRDQQID